MTNATLLIVEDDGILAAMFRGGERKDCHLPLRTKNSSLAPAVSRIWRGNWNGRPQAKTGAADGERGLGCVTI